jgi:hypothetical protein
VTHKDGTVTFRRDTSGVTERDISRARPLLTEGGKPCHGVTVRDVTHRSVTDKRDSHGHCPDGRDSEERCTKCQVGQGDNCDCRDAQIKAKRKPRRSFWDMSCSTFWRGYVFGLVLCWLVGYLAARA